jgi:hypothetical protein
MRNHNLPPEYLRLERRAARFLLAIAALAMAFLASEICAQTTAKQSPQHDARLDARDAEGLTPLVAAASAGQADAVKSLLARGAGVDATAADGRTALIAAAQSGKIETVQALIAAGANLNRTSRGTGTALNVAENKGESEIAALLRASGAQSTGKSPGDTVCVRPWEGNGFCGTVRSFSMASVQIEVTKVVGCEHGCSARPECSASRPVGGNDGVQAGEQIAVPSWCLTHTGVKP